MRRVATAAAGGLAALLASTSLYGGSVGNAASLEIANKPALQTFRFPLEIPPPCTQAGDAYLELKLSVADYAKYLQLCSDRKTDVSLLDSLESADPPPEANITERTDAKDTGNGTPQPPVSQKPTSAPKPAPADNETPDSGPALPQPTPEQTPAPDQPAQPAPSQPTPSVPAESTKDEPPAGPATPVERENDPVSASASDAKGSP